MGHGFRSRAIGTQKGGRLIVQSDVPSQVWPQIPGLIHYEQERYEEFLEWAENGLKSEPESFIFHEHRFVYLALHGFWKRAWQDWEYRDVRQRLLVRLAQWPEWKGDRIAGSTLLVAGELGIGDQIMFSRWLGKAALASGARKIVFEARRELQRWSFEAAFGFGEWLTVVAGGEKLPPFDFWIGLESLPLITGTPDPFPAGTMRQATNVKRVGVCWHGDARIRVDAKRSTDFRMWLPLLEVTDLYFRSLQHGECPDPRMEPLGEVADIADTSRRIMDLDLVITVDTAIGHLAGTMGLPVWVLSYRPPEWRWGLDGERATWYPSMRLFRQERRGEWGPVFERVKAELQRAARAGGG